MSIIGGRFIASVTIGQSLQDAEVHVIDKVLIPYVPNPQNGNSYSNMHVYVCTLPNFQNAVVNITPIQIKQCLSEYTPKI